MKQLKLIIIMFACITITVNSKAQDSTPKRTLKMNMNEVYNTVPQSVDTLKEVFAQGIFYGRIRSNFFRWDYLNNDNGDNKAFGLGGSLIYKTASLNGFSATTAFYYSNSPVLNWRMADDDIDNAKAGKDTFSRYNVYKTGDWQMAVLGEAYLQYSFSKTNIKFGRQIFESALTSSNDTKMIPNTFEGISFESDDIIKTKVKLAYFTTQKLRDHTTFHDVLTTGIKGSMGKEHWNYNDDIGVHWGLNIENLKAAGKSASNELIVAAVSNKAIENLKLDMTYTAVPQMLSSIIGEINYKIPIGGFSLTPGVRYMQQFDNGAGKIGGASLNGNVNALNASQNGYTKGDSLNAKLWMARLGIANRAFKGHIGYSKMADEADIVAPWRGFPTGGYTRAIAQYNWRANTKTLMFEVQYDFAKEKIISGFKVLMRYAIQDFDEKKQSTGIIADNSVIHIDLMQQLTTQMDAKFRLGMINADNRVSGINIDSYNEYRLEVNYMF